MTACHRGTGEGQCQGLRDEASVRSMQPPSCRQAAGLSLVCLLGSEQALPLYQYHSVESCSVTNAEQFPPRTLEHHCREQPFISACCCPPPCPANPPWVLSFSSRQRQPRPPRQAAPLQAPPGKGQLLQLRHPQDLMPRDEGREQLRGEQAGSIKQQTLGHSLCGTPGLGTDLKPKRRDVNLYRLTHSREGREGHVCPKAWRGHPVPCEHRYGG